MITPELQSAFIEGRPDLFLPIHGGWGRMGMTHIRLAEADEDSLQGALQAAWKLRVEKNQKPGSKAGGAKKQSSAGTKSAIAKVAKKR